MSARLAVVLRDLNPTGMDLRQIKYFVVAVEAGTLTKASQRLYVAQSAISKQIAALEHELDARLLERGRHGVRPTQSGSFVYEAAKEILQKVADLRSEVKRQTLETSDRPHED